MRLQTSHVKCDADAYMSAHRATVTVLKADILGEASSQRKRASDAAATPSIRLSEETPEFSQGQKFQDHQITRKIYVKTL